MKTTPLFEKKYPKAYGSLIAVLGVLILTPDTMLIRFSKLEKWNLMGFRGVLMGITLFLIWYLFFKSNSIKKLKSLFSFHGIIFILAFAANSICFTLGIIETSVIVVLTAVATMPLFAALLSIFLMKESQGWIGWTSIIIAMLGVFLVVNNGDSATGHPQGSVILGSIYGIFTAICLALTFTMVRKFPNLEVMPASAIGATISGIVGFTISSKIGIFDSPLWTIITMGSFILPISFTLLLIAAKFTSSAVVSLIMLIEMVIGPFWVWIGVGEKPSFVMICGAFLVLVVIIFHISFTQFNNIKQ